MKLIKNKDSLLCTVFAASKLLVLSLSIGLYTGYASAQNLTGIKEGLTLDSNPLSSLEVGQTFQYRITWQCSFTNTPPPEGCGDFLLTDALAPGLEFVSCSTSSDYSCVESGGTVTVDKVGGANGINLGDGDASEVLIFVRLSTDPADYPGGVYPTTMPNSADITSGQPIVSPDVDLPVNPPQNNWEIGKSVLIPAAPLDPALDNNVIYEIELCPNGPAGIGTGTIFLNNPVITDVCEAGAIFVSAELGGTPILPTAPNVMCPGLAFDLGTQLDPADGCQTIELALQYPSGSFNVGDNVTNVAVASSDEGPVDPCSGSCSNTVTQTLSVPNPDGEVNKVVKRSEVAPGAFDEYLINFDTLNSNVVLSNAVFEDVFPSEITATGFSHAGWDDQTVIANVVELPSNTPIVSNYDGTGFNHNFSAGATGFSVNFTVPIPPGFESERFTVRFQVDAGLSTGDSFDNCATLDAAEISVEQDCATVNIVDPRSDIRASKLMPAAINPGEEFDATMRFIQDNTSSDGAVNPVLVDCLPPELEFVSWDDVDFFSGLDDPRDPIDTGNFRPLGVMPNFEYLAPGDAANSCSTGGGMLRWSWKAAAPTGSLQIDRSAGVSNPFLFPVRPDRNSDNLSTVADGALGLYIELRMAVTLKVRPATPEQTGLQNLLQTIPESSNYNCIESGTADVNDIDGDGNTTETVCTNQVDFAVLSAATYRAEKFVGGFNGLPNIDPDNPPSNATSSTATVPTYCPLDADGRTRTPCIAQGMAGQPFDYQVRLSNDGNVPLTDYVAYDIFPYTGDVGITESQAGAARGTTWTPILIGPIVPVSANPVVQAELTANAIVEYSASTNPCRPEMSLAADNDWQASCVDDWTETPLADTTTFPDGYGSVRAWRIKVPFASGWPIANAADLSEEDIVVNISMLAPNDALRSDYDANDVQIAWNNIGHRGTNLATGLRLLASEARKTGIALPEDFPLASGGVRVGNLVWFDTNNDGVAQNGEPGIFDVTVQLWQDITGNGPSADDILYDQQQTDALGHYLFDHSDPRGADGILGTADDVRDSLGMPDGDYYVVIPTDQQGSFALGEHYSSTGAGNNTDADGNNDNDDNGASTNVGTGISTTDINSPDIEGIYSGTVDLTQGLEPVDEQLRSDDATDDDNDFFTDADSNVSVDFGFYQFRLGNHIWLDTGAGSNTNNGVADSDENSVQGLEVELWLDDGDGIFDPTVDTQIDADVSTAAIDTVVTDAQGQYLYEGLDIGNYFVSIPSGQTGLTAGGVTYTSDALTSSTPTSTAANALTNDNQDDGALGVFGGSEYLAVTPLLSLTPATAQINESDTSSDGVTGGSNTDVTDANAEFTINIANNASLPDVNSFLTADFGLVNTVSLGSTVWQDLNGNGLQDVGETPIENATITLLNSDGSVYDSDPVTPGDQALTVMTDSNGQYNFNQLPAGDYRVQVDLSSVPNGSTLFPTPIQVADPDAAGAGQNNNTDSNIDAAFDTNLADQVYTSGVITLAPGTEPTSEVDPIGAGATATTPDQPMQGLTPADDPDSSGNMTVDFGFVTPVSVGSTLWQDTNGNGTQDDGEPPIEDATVTLLNADGTPFDSDPSMPGTQLLTVMSDDEGQYNFNNLPPGNYRIQVDTSTATSGLAFVPTPTQVANPNNNDNTDSNIDVSAPGHSPATGVFQSGIISLSSGGEPINELDPIDNTNGNGPVADQPGQTLTPFDDPDSSGNMTVDFGFIAPVSIGSLVWNDLNGDGLQSANEPPVPGTQVSLLVDNGTSFVPATNVSGGVVPTQTTGTDGLYFFDNLPPGDYKVIVTPPSGLVPSLVQNPNDDNVENDSNINTAPTTPLPAGTYESAVINLQSGGEIAETDTQRGDGQDSAVSGTPLDLSGNMTVDFGFVQLASIGDRVWIDIDMDGVQDANEDPLPGIGIMLTPPPGIDIGAGPGNPITTTTDANGNYLFPDLPPYTNADPNIGYVVSVDTGTLPAAYVQTYDEGVGGTPGPLDHTSAPIQLDPAEAHLTADFGYVPADGSIGDTIWIDANGDGVQDPGELGIPNVTVMLTPPPSVDLGAGPGVPISVMTDQNGKYLFTNLPLGQVYEVMVDETTLPAGYVSDADGDGDPDVRDGNSTSADGKTTVELTMEMPINLDADFGYLPPAEENNSVGDTVWLDVDGDGIQNNGESGIAGVTIELRDTAGNVVASTVTDGNGNYLFTGIPDGQYDVVVTDTNGVLSTLNQTFDDDGLGSPNTSRVDLDSTNSSTSPVVDLDQDFGYNSPNPVTDPGNGVIGDTVFFDGNNNGSPDLNEGIQGVVVELYDSTGVLIASTVTDANGQYLFTGLPTSPTGEQYQVIVDTSTLPNGGAGWTNSVDPDGPNPGDSTSLWTLTDAEPENLDQDFGYIGDANNSITGTVWSDTDGDGELTESGMFEGVVIVLLDENGDIIQETETDANGNYEFTNLPDGIYSVLVRDDNNVLNGFEHTDSPNGSSDTSDQTSKDDTGYTIDLDSAGILPTPVTDATGDFGYEPVVTNPITLGSALAKPLGSGKVLVSWTTQTEVANLGFNVYGLVAGQWVQLNDALILSLGDSTRVQSYKVSVATDAKVFAISDIDLAGQETLHEPFLLNRLRGQVEQRKKTDWQLEKQQRQRKAQEREVLRQQQLQQRNLLRKQQHKQRIKPEISKPISKKEDTMHQSLAMKFATLVLSAIVPTAQAMQAEDLINVEVSEAGIYEITHQQLMDFGLDIAGVPVEELGLYSQGQAIPVEISGSQTNDNVFGEGAAIRFLGETFSSLYTDKNIYTLRIEQGAQKQINEDNRTPIPGIPAATSYLAKAVFDKQSEYSFTSPNPQDPWSAEKVVAVKGRSLPSANIPFEITDYQPGGNNGSTKAKLSVNVWGGTDLPSVLNEHQMQVAFNGLSVINKQFGGLTEKTYDTELNNIREGQNQVNVSLPLANGVNYDVVKINEVTVQYPRKFRAINGALSFTSQHRYFNVRDFVKPERIQNNDYDSQLLVYRKDGSGNVFRLSQAKLRCGLQPTCRAEFAGSGSNDDYYVALVGNVLTATLKTLPVEQDIQSGQAAYLIISHPDFIGARAGLLAGGTGLLEGLASQLSNEFGSADIVDVEAVYAQYNHHIFGPKAIQDYIQFAVNNRGTQYVLLVGGDVYDYQDFVGLGATSFIPSIYAATGNNITFAPVDAKYVDFDNDNVPDLPIGRLPVRTVEELQNLIAKRAAYKARTYGGKLLLAADSFDDIQQYDFKADAEKVKNDYFNNWAVSTAYSDDLGVSQARQTLINKINQGQTLTSFFGHSSTNRWSFDGLFSGSDAAGLNNVGKPTIVTQWGCWNTYFVDPQEDSMGHRFLMEGAQGAVAVMGASTLTNADAERRLAKLIFARLANGERLGNAITNAKEEYASNYPQDLDVLLGWTLLGYPELTIN